MFEEDEKQTVLARKIKVTKGEIIDSAFMSKKALCDFFEKQIKTTPKDVLFSLHLKATMMKISDPKMFGHCVRAYYKEALEKYGSEGSGKNLPFSSLSEDLKKKDEEKD